MACANDGFGGNSICTASDAPSWTRLMICKRLSCVSFARRFNSAFLAVTSICAGSLLLSFFLLPRRRGLDLSRLRDASESFRSSDCGNARIRMFCLQSFDQTSTYVHRGKVSLYRVVKVRVLVRMTCRPDSFHSLCHKTPFTTRVSD